jgi:hypothetical protein
MSIQQTATGRARYPLLLTTIIDEKRAAKFLGVHPKTMSRWRKTRTGPAWIPVGRQIKYAAVVLNAWLVEHQVNPS